MGFKIVAFLNTKKNVTVMEYAYVPENWEKDGKVRWPKGSKAATEKLRKNGNSCPQIDWTEYTKVIVKKVNIKTIEEAELWEDKYIGAEDSEAENFLEIDFPKKGNEKQNTKNNEYEVLFDQVMIPVATSDHSAAAAATLSFDNTLTNNINMTDDLLIFPNNEELKQLKEDNKKLKVENNCLKEMLSSFDHNLKTITIITEKTYDLLKKQIYKGSSSTNSISDMEEFTSEESTLNNKFAFPINNSESLINFNKEIESSNQLYKKFLVEKYSKIGGCDGKENGDKIGRQLLSLMFSPTLMVNYSWTGVSRTSGVSKKSAFQTFTGIVDLFFILINKADCRWTESLNMKFFKEKILKHSKQIKETFEKNQLKKKNAVFNPSDPGEEEQSNDATDEQSNDTNDLERIE